MRKRKGEIGLEQQWKELLEAVNKLALKLDKETVNKLRNGQHFKTLEKLLGQNELRGLLNELKGMVSQSDLQPFYSTLKKLGFQTEMKLNEQIQGSLNRREIIQLLHKYAHTLAPLLEGLREMVEILSGPLNIPTKNDVANVAKLSIQNEEKLDSIEEQLLILNQHLKLLSEDVPTFKKTKVKEQTRQDQRELKKLKLFNYILQSPTNQLQRKE